MKVKRNAILVLLVASMLLLAACGRGRNNEEEPADAPAPAAEVAPTDTPVPPTDTPVPPTNTPVPPTNTPEPEPSSSNTTSSDTTSSTTTEGNESLYGSASDVLNSYRTKGTLAIVSTLPDESQKTQNMKLEGTLVVTDDEYGSDEYFQVDIDENGETQSMAIYKIGGDVTVLADGEWMTLGRDQAGMFTIMADIFTGLVDEFGVGIQQAENVGTEQVNGINATRYQINDPQLFQQLAQFDGMNEESTEVINSVEMNIWVATDGNYVVKYSIFADVSGATELDDAGNEILVDQVVDWSFELYDPNGPTAVTLPEDAPDPGVIEIPGFAEGTFPLPEGAEISRGFMGVEVRSDLPEAEFVQFYTDALPALGWTFEGSFGFYEVKKDDVTFSMFISTDDESGQTVAQIFSEP